MINFEKGIPLRSLHIRKGFRPISICGFWVDDKLAWGHCQCTIFDFGSRIVIRRPGYVDEFLYPHAIRSAQLKDPLDMHCILQPDKVGSSGKTAANEAVKKSGPRGRQSAALTQRLIRHDERKQKD